MTRKYSLVIVLTAAVWVMAASAPRAQQPSTDFFGRWVLESEALPSAPTELVIRQIAGEGGRPKEVRVTRHGATGTSLETLYVGTIGGTVPGSGGGPRTFRRVTWEGSTLVIDVETLRGQSGDRAPSERRREAWSVTPDGKLQIVITESGPSRTTQTVALVYRQVKEPAAQERHAIQPGA